MLRPDVLLGLVSGRIVMAPEAVPEGSEIVGIDRTLDTNPAGLVLVIWHPTFPELGPGESGWFPALFTCVQGPTTFERYTRERKGE